MDDLAFFADSLEDLEKHVCQFLSFCKAKNLKLKTSKFVISESVEFAGATLNAELVRGEQVVNILPKSGRISAFQDLKRPETKTELRSYCGMVSSLAAWTPSVNLNMPLLRKNCAKNGKVDWSAEMVKEYEAANELMLTQVKLSPYNSEKALYLLIE